MATYSKVLLSDSTSGKNISVTEHLLGSNTVDVTVDVDHVGTSSPRLDG